MQNIMTALLTQIIREGKKQGLEQKDMAEKAGITQETLSRAKKATDIQLSTLVRLSEAVGLKLTLVPASPILEKILSGDVFGEERP